MFYMSLLHCGLASGWFACVTHVYVLSKLPCSIVSSTNRIINREVLFPFTDWYNIRAFIIAESSIL